MEHLLDEPDTARAPCRSGRDSSARSYEHGVGASPLCGLHIFEHFSQIARQFPSHEAVVSVPQNVRVTYDRLCDEVDVLARGLVAMGFGAGDRIAIWSTNNVEWVMIQLATARIGAILVNINPAYRPRELAHALRTSEIQALITTPGFEKNDYVATLLELIPMLRDPATAGLHSKEFPHLRRVIVFQPEAPTSDFRPHAGFTTWNDVLVASSQISLAEVNSITETLDPDDAINIQYTSGTTGLPKAVILTHHNILNNALACAESMGFTNTDRLCVPVPFYHCFGMVLANLMCLSVGGCVVIPCQFFSADDVLQALDLERCTALHGVPTMFVAELEAAAAGRYDLTQLRTGIMAGAPCPPLIMKRVMTELHCPEILIGYGQTEASPLTNLTTRFDCIEQRTETVGRALPHQELKVVDVESSAIVDRGQTGEVCFRGYHVMTGYYGDAEATRRVIDDAGWLHSGDLGALDTQGYLSITGRLKDMIIRGGENIYPREIEDFLYTHPDVAEVAVFGIPDDAYGEEVAAWIQLRPGHHATRDDIRNYCRGNIAHFKVPKYIEFVHEFPMTVTGKFQKFRMRELTLEQMAATTG